MEELKKVVHILRRINPQLWGGTEQVVHHIAKSLMKNNTKSPIYCTDMFDKKGHDIINGVEIQRYPYIFPWFGLSEADKHQLMKKGGSPFSFSMLKALLIEPNIDIIHAHVQHRLGGIARTIAKIKELPYVVSLHGGLYTIPKEEVETMRAPFKGKLEWGKSIGALLGSRRVIQDANAIICVGENEYNEVQKRWPKKKVIYLPNGVDTRSFKMANAKLFKDTYGITEDETVLMCVSRIDHQKNQLALIHAFSNLVKKQSNWTLVLVGSTTQDEYLKTLQKSIKNYGIEKKVRIIGGIEGNSPLLFSAFKAADIFVLPSIHEPFGIVILEAWAAGTPVIAANIGGIKKFTRHNQNCLHINPNTPNEITTAIETLIQNPQLERQLIQNGLKEVQGYDWEIITQKIQTLYQTTIEAHKSSKG